MTRESAKPESLGGAVEPTRRRGRGRGLVLLVRGAGWCLLAAMTVWAFAAIWIDMRPAWLRAPILVLYVVGLSLLLAKSNRRSFAVSGVGAGFLMVLGWWLTLRPSNDRDWQPDVAVLPYAEVAGDRVTVHNIRDCEYRTETDFDVRHYEKTFDLSRLRTADLFMVYWGSPHMAHTMVSFGFAGGDYLCFSIETRKEKGESYSAIKGLFRQFELVYVAADERDLIRLRTNYRSGEEVFLYRLHGSTEQVRGFFMAYVRRMNALRERPEWYSALTHNCTTSIRLQRAAADRAPWDWRMLANGHGDEMIYERGMIATNLPLAELKQLAHVNARARAADAAADFSRAIREGIPEMNP